MDLQRENHSALNQAEDSRRQQRKGKGVKSSILQTEQQMPSVEIEYQNASEDLQGNDKDHCTDSPSPPEKLIAGILGVICLILMYIVVRVIVFIPSLATLKENSSFPARKIQKGCCWIISHHLSSAYACGHCPQEWFTYSNNCYYVSTEPKTWTESLVACASKNSSLIYIDNEQEREFLSSLLPASWIGVFRRSSDHPWMWINGSTPTLEIAGSTFGNWNCATLYRNGFTSSSCESSKTYICKHRFYC